MRYIYSEMYIQLQTSDQKMLGTPNCRKFKKFAQTPMIRFLGAGIKC